MTKKTIMVVDDETRLVSLVENYLSQEGYQVVTAKDGKQALDVAKRAKPDLIILDIMMPEMDGYEFMRVHRAENNTPIILLTARVDDDERIVGLELGADDYVTKPFRPRELWRVCVRFCAAAIIKKRLPNYCAHPIFLLTVRLAVCKWEIDTLI
jgi:DNA-binding response OmpR family regulator